MDLTEFIKKENILKDIALELIQAQKHCEELRIEHLELFKELKNNARMLKLQVIDGQFVQGNN